MELSDEQKKQLEEQKANCPFCQIVAGKIPAQKVYEDKKIIAILDINPAKEGHVLVMTKEHYPIAPLIPEEDFDFLITRLQQITQKIKESLLLTNSANIFIANGGAAGQQAPHFMIHIIPRQKNDGFKNFKLNQKDISEEKIQELQKILAHNTPLILKDKAQKYAITQVETNNITIEQIIEILNQNPKLKDLILNEPQKAKEFINNNEKLKLIFEKINLEEIINILKSPNSSKQESKNDSDTNQSNTSLDDISKLFKNG